MIRGNAGEARNSGGLRCLLLAPSDPVTRGPRTAAVLRYRHPPQGVKYTLETDRFTYPRRLGYYDMNPASVGLSAFRFFLEHAVPPRNRGNQLVHSFFWDLRNFHVPWVHESDQSLGQFLSGYTNIRGLARSKILEVFAMYLNSSRCRCAVTWTEWSRRGFEEDGVDPAKVSVVPPPFETVHDRKEHKECNVLFLGRDFKRKGGALALEAFASASAEPASRLLYIGKIDDPKALRQTKGNKKIVHLENPTNETIRREVWPITDILILPTRNDAFAVAVADAMRRGIPVITSSLPPLSEVVEDGVSGYLIPPRDSEGFARALQRLIESPDRRASIGEKALSRSAALFSPDKVGTALANAYSS